MQANRLIEASCEGTYKKNKTHHHHIPIIVRGRRQRRRQRGGILPLLIPATVLAAAATWRKKRVGKISAARWATNKRRVRQTLRRTGMGPLEKLAIFK